MGRNPQITAVAFKKAKAKLAKIKQLGILPDMTVEAIDALVMNLAEAKAIENSAPVANYVKGQQWYVQSLVDFAGLTAAERLDFEYNDCFAEVASEEELVAMLEDAPKVEAA